MSQNLRVSVFTQPKLRFFSACGFLYKTPSNLNNVVLIEQPATNLHLCLSALATKISKPKIASVANQMLALVVSV
jgi:citrate lyase synthetase